MVSSLTAAIFQEIVNEILPQAHACDSPGAKIGEQPEREMFQFGGPYYRFRGDVYAFILQILAFKKSTPYKNTMRMHGCTVSIGQRISVYPSSIKGGYVDGYVARISRRTHSTLMRRCANDTRLC